MTGNRLRIAMLSAHSCPVGDLGAKDTGGMSVYIREIARKLGEKGHSVDVYTRAHDPRDKQVYEIGPNARLIHLRAGEDRSVHKLALYSYLPEFTCNLENFRKQNGLKYDVVFSHYWLSGWAGKLLQQWWQVPHMIMFHTLGAVKNVIGVGEAEPQLRLETERDLARTCHLVIAPTEKEKENLILHYGVSPERVSVVPCGVNLELFQPIDRRLSRDRLGFADEKIILFVGRIEPLKGIEQLLRAMPYLAKEHQSKLVIIGGDKDSQQEIERLKGLSRSLHIQNSITFSGMVKPEQLPYYYSAADVCVIPSYYESFGLVALESLACGTPVVATDVGDLSNIIREGEAGYVIKENDPRILADKIKLVLSRPVSNRETTIGIRAPMVRFDWTNIAETLSYECQRLVTEYSALTAL
jgi:D-inositol-3-phosphate glycosyltransferase